MVCVKFIALILPALIGVAFFTLLERKFLSLVGFRLGPSKVSLYGILQPVGDAIKLSNKQLVLLSNFSSILFFFSSGLMIMSSFWIWTGMCFYPLSMGWSLPILFFMFLLAVNSLNSILSGWASYSKFSLIGGLRMVSQLISYESVLYFCIFFFLVFLFGFGFNCGLVLIPFFCFPLCFFIWLPSFLAELNRTPFDFSEGESELVSGFNTEFGSNSFTLIFLSEYSNILFFCTFSGLIFFFPMFFLSFILFCMFVLWSRSVLPRFRFDKLMSLAWKFFIPLLTFYFIFYCVLCY